jgi:hypothetical protein
MRVTRQTVTGTALLVVALFMVGCGGGIAATMAPTSPAPSPPITASRVPVASVTAGPPEAALGVEGGEPVSGQLGSYTWRDTGSDGPWLRGAPIAVGPGEALTVAFSPRTEPTSWRARYAPAGHSDATGARSLGDGTGRPTSFAAPPVGGWTVALDVVFGAGTATYYWEVAVR